MAMIDPWTPGPVEGMVPDAGVAAQVGSFMDDPRARAALLSFGLQMMQPPSFGDNFASQFGRAVGAGGEGAARVNAQGMKEEELAIKQTEADSRQDLRGAQADRAISQSQVAEARANQAGTVADSKTAMLNLREREMLQRKDLSMLQNRLRAQAIYNKYVDEVNSRNNDVMRDRKAPKEPILSQPEWLTKNGFNFGLDAAGGGGTGTGIPDSDPGLPPTPSLGRPQSGSNLNPPLPRDPKQRKSGQVYAAPNGQNVQWDGTGLIEVP